MDPNNANSTESRVPGVLAGSIVPATIGSLFVIARLYTRKLICNTWGLDDTLISLSWLGALGLAVMNSLSVAYGTGHKAVFQSEADIISIMKLAFASRLIYQFVLCTTKLGIGCYSLQFFRDRTSKLIAYPLLGFVLVSAVTIEFTFIFSCKPVSDAWTLGAQNCLPVTPIFITNTVCNVVGDLALMAFLIPRIAPLQMSRRQKASLFSVVGLGLLVIVAAVFRLTAIVKLNKTQDFAWDGVYITTWTSTEVFTGLVCASAPCTRPLIRKMSPTLFTTLSTPFTSRPTTPQASPDSSSLNIKTAQYSQSIKSQPRTSRTFPTITAIKKSFSRDAISQKTKLGLEEVKLKTIKAKRLDKGTFAYAIQKREEAFQNENETMYLNHGESVESWLGRCEEEEEVKRAARSASISEDGDDVLARIGNSLRECDPSLSGR
ncbi:hypothetical protein LZ554_008746 [Drepanopeziza brunnea f. sp. 'monogermtubi']|nr:hypothetical protein LZ554_008746 [Drepanopeziza brunnea f. sp. 'monogermtubi']